MKGKQILIINGHPDKESFNFALALAQGLKFSPSFSVMRFRIYSHDLFNLHSRAYVVRYRYWKFDAIVCI